MSHKVRRIHRSEHNSSNHFFILTRSSVQDARLSFEARGVLAYLLSKPDDWELMPEDIASQGNIGRNKAYRIIKELMDHGYITRTMHRNEKKQIVRVDYQVFEKPLPQNQEIGLQEIGFGDSIHIRDKDIKEIKQTKGERSKDVCLSRSTSEEIAPQDQEVLLLEEKEKGQGTATVIDMNTDIYAPAMTALATEFGHFATYDEQRLLERHIDERGLPAVLDAIQNCKQINAHPHAPAKYVLGYLNNTPHVTSEMTEHVKAYSSPKTNNIPDYKPTQSEYADLKEIAKHATPNDLARFIRSCKEEPFWQFKIVGTPYIRRNIGAWKAQQ